MKKITIFGGDNRMQTVYEELHRHGHPVDSYGLYPNDLAIPETSDIFLLPVPTTKDGVTVYAPLTERIILINDIEEMAEDRLVLVGNHTINVARCVDYCRSDSYAIRNAVPTAEGALAIAIKNTPFTLWNSRVLVIGNGRVGKIMADRLRVLGCKVTVSARKSSDFALIETNGMSYIKTANIALYADEYDIIFNTVDAPVLDYALPHLCGKLIIDLASSPVVNAEDARKLGVNYIKAPGLPGKVAPVTAGKILTETVLELIAQKS